MFELMVILAFIAVLMICVVLDISVVLALVIGYFIFFLYGVKAGFGAKNVFMMSVAGVKTVKNLLFTFMIIGMVTGLWRASGTIPVIIAYSSKLIHPSTFIAIAFLLNALVSFLIGTSFGTAATMGVICMTMARALGVNEFYVGGAILSGVYWGDRCSPVSTSALLVSELTKTELYENIKGMFKTGAIPTVITIVIYLVFGFLSGGDGEIMNMEAIFERGFVLHWSLVLPAAAILVLAMLKFKVKQTLVVSIVIAAVLGVLVQGMSLAEVLKVLVSGYVAPDAELGEMMNGGGMMSMVRTVVIVGLSSSFSGIFDGTGLLVNLKHYVGEISKRVTPYGAVLLTSVVTSMIACNQTLSVILTHQLCVDVEPDRKEMAMYLENTVILMAALVPWSIAGGVPLASVGAPVSAMAFACYLYVVPVWDLVMHMAKRKRV